MTSQESINWEQEQYAELINDLKNIDTIYVSGSHISQGIWKHFNIYYIKNNKLVRVFIYHTLNKDQKPQAWDQKTNSFKSNVLGMDRTFEIVYSLYKKVYPYDPKNTNNDALDKMPKIEFLSYFDRR